ncbi:MAG: DUF1365 domain-containing protein [Deltaproteobacteria bacterium]|nr:DUF1365 domain-containing protein [Deltaproteobacteria bacterium]
MTESGDRLETPRGETALYVGAVRHARYAPRRHVFRLPLYMLYLDLEELATMRSSWVFGVEKPGLLSYRRADYLGRSTHALREEVLNVVESTLGIRTTGPIRLLTQVRAFGFVFNPVSFYYCFEEDGTTLAAVVAEITNTPWGERHRYVLGRELGRDQHGDPDRHNDGRAPFERIRGTFQKDFHVSPFFPMDQQYAWCFTKPTSSLSVVMKNRQGDRTVFSAQLALRRRSLSTRSLLGVALRMPAQSARTLGMIYAHAGLLWLKRVPVFDHPKNARSSIPTKVEAENGQRIDDGSAARTRPVG